jgi:hypothetical protein
MHLVGIMGPARAGKDSLARLLLRLRPGAQVLAFADPLWAAVEAVAGPGAFDRHGPSKDLPCAALGGATPREWAIAFGTGARTHLGPDVWVRNLLRRVATLPPGAVGVVVDVRKRNEAAAIREAGGLLVGLDRAQKARGVEDTALEADWRAIVGGPIYLNTTLDSLHAIACDIGQRLA